MKRKFIGLLSMSTCLLLASPVLSAADFQCYRAAKAGSWVKSRIPKGNWGPQHNTSKWSYAPIPGKDIFRHRNGNRTVGTRCKGVGYNYGEHKVDFQGNQDWCATYSGGWGAAATQPNCPQGYALTANKQRCTRAAKPGAWVKTRQPQGNWSPIHNTSKWSYAAIPGGDIYRHRNGNRTVGTRCSGPGYNHGTLKVDLVGYQDWCANWSPGVAAHTTNASCPANFRLQMAGGVIRTPAIRAPAAAIRKPIN